MKGKGGHNFLGKLHVVIFTGKVNQKRNSASNFSMKNVGLAWTLKCVKFILQTKLLLCFEILFSPQLTVWHAISGTFKNKLQFLKTFLRICVQIFCQSNNFIKT